MKANDCSYTVEFPDNIIPDELSGVVFSLLPVYGSDLLPRANAQSVAALHDHSCVVD
jgi:hypothetical protein